MKFDAYPTEFPEYFRVVDLRSGKKTDDGYKAIHLYYQRDSHSYPIEIQLWCGRDYQFNVWSHQYVYKYKNLEIEKQLYLKYESGAISCEREFIDHLKKWRMR